MKAKGIPINVMEKKIHKWIDECNPDWLNRTILVSLLIKYDKGSDTIFRKMRQLENDGHFKLCEIFRQCFVNVGINEEYLKWRGL